MNSTTTKKCRYTLHAQEAVIGIGRKPGGGGCALANSASAQATTMATIYLALRRSRAPVGVEICARANPTQFGMNAAMGVHSSPQYAGFKELRYVLPPSFAPRRLVEASRPRVKGGPGSLRKARDPESEAF